MAESTALEALTAELLGDVGLLHDHVKHLAKTLPEISQALKESLADEAEKVDSAAQRLAQALDGMEVRINQATVRAANAALLKARAEQETQLSHFLKELLDGEVTRVGNRIVSDAKPEIDEAARKFAEIAAGATREVALLAKKAEENKFGAGKLFLAFLLVSFAGGMVGAAIIHWLG